MGRPQNVIFSGLLASGSWYILGGPANRALACYGVIGCLYFLAVLVNNRVDTDVDRSNGRMDNPFVHSIFSPATLAGLYAAPIIILAVLLFWLRQPGSLIVAIGYALAMMLYSLPPFSLQRRGYFGTLCLGICYGSLPVILDCTNHTSLLCSWPGGRCLHAF